MSRRIGQPVPPDPRDDGDEGARAPGVPGGSPPPAPSPRTEAPWDGRYERRRPTMAELAVPWLIGIILLLVGVVILLLVLLFSEDDPALGRRAFPDPGSVTAVGGGTATPTPAAPPPIGGPVETPRAPQPSAAPGASAAPESPRFSFGETELAYLARPDPLAPIELLRDDFATDAAPIVLATAAEGVNAHDWAPDGSVGVALVAGIAVAIEPGSEPRRLADGVAAIEFGADAATVYAVRIAEDGETQTATVIGLDFATGAERTITQVSYPNPVVSFPSRVEEAQFADDGGPIRLAWLDDARLALVVPGGPTLAIDPADGAQVALQAPPLLWSPEGGLHAALQPDAGITTLQARDADGEVVATTSVSGAVSHLRWAPDGDRIVFTVGIGTADGGVRQDLYVWAVTGETGVTALTANGASFGGEWLGAKETWRA